MSTLVNWNGQQYLVPAYNDTGYAQGNGNLSQYLVAISTGSLQQVGGLFQLTADADFGPNFGLVSSYYKSRSANIASAGVLRLANTDAIKWRNSDNSADVTLAMNATGTAARTYTIPDLATSDFVMSEGAQTINGIKSFGSAILIPDGSAAVPGLSFAGETGANTGFYLVGQNNLGITTQGVLKMDISATAITMALPVAMGSNKITGLAAGTTNGDALRYEQLVGAYLPLAGGTMSGNIAFGGTYKLTGLAAGTGNGDSLRYEQLFGAYLALSGGTLTGALLLADGTQADPSIGFASNSAVGFYKGSANTMSAVINNVVVVGFSGSLGVSLLGTATSNSAAAGYVGEYVESVVSGVNNPTSDQWGDLTSISLTAGDWDVDALKVTLTGATMTAVAIGISTTSGNSATGLVSGSNWLDSIQSFVSSGTCSQVISSYRVSLASTATIYLKFKVTTASTLFTSSGRLSARRVR